MAKEIKYAYKIELAYRNKKTEEKIVSTAIKVIMIDHDYYRNNMPSIFITLNLKSAIYNDMILNSATGKMYLKVSKYNKDDTKSLTKTYIESVFDYYFPTNDIEYNQALFSNTGSIDDTYRSTVIGLIDNTLVSRNKKTINGIIDGSNLSTIINYYIGGSKLVMEPLSNNPTVSNLIIPPLDSTAKLIQFLDDHYSIYNSECIYYLDFNTTYLISTAGNAIFVGDDTFSTLKLNILSSSTKKSDAVIQGIVEDLKQKIYIMNINANDTSININKVLEKKFTKIMVVDTEGRFVTVDLPIDKNNDTTEKLKVVRAFTTDQASSLRSQIGSSNVVLSVTKADIDMSLIVPYKEYYIDNVDEYKSYNGRYALISKKEVYSPQDGVFYCSSLMNFKKLI